jgi:hypothetical protein
MCDVVLQATYLAGAHMEEMLYRVQRLRQPELEGTFHHEVQRFAPRVLLVELNISVAFWDFWRFKLVRNKPDKKVVPRFLLNDGHKWELVELFEEDGAQPIVQFAFLWN